MILALFITCGILGLVLLSILQNRKHILIRCIAVVLLILYWSSTNVHPNLSTGQIIKWPAMLDSHFCKISFYIVAWHHPGFAISCVFTMDYNFKIGQLKSKMAGNVSIHFEKISFKFDEYPGNAAIDLELFNHLFHLWSCNHPQMIVG